MSVEAAMPLDRFSYLSEYGHPEPESDVNYRRTTGKANESRFCNGVWLAWSCR